MHEQLLLALVKVVDVKVNVHKKKTRAPFLPYSHFLFFRHPWIIKYVRHRMAISPASCTCTLRTHGRRDWNPLSAPRIIFGAVGSFIRMLCVPSFRFPRH